MFTSTETAKLVDLAERFVVAFERIAANQDRLAIVAEANMKTTQDALKRQIEMMESLKDEMEDEMED